ncbi:phage shock protein A [Parabacteroides sp. PFB2-12]|uniref:hypothetical protein n=1 Tax=unclassified Parabacteroides TaxID=2649774 RepID=UPI002474D710|nr:MULTISPECIES: hypothetical protein [unclassified Parabacteroides]MDH6341910.1 phage shock protein A [Parabacteroides sp. PM6-13]MDH6389608.1 phage shock protein A [Parabacteroides sp. PFB2-12]
MGTVILIILGIALGFGLGIFAWGKMGGAKLKEDVVRLRKEKKELEVHYQEQKTKLSNLSKAAKAVSDLQKAIKNGIPDFSSESSEEKRLYLMENFWNAYYNGEQFIKERSPESDRFFRDLYRALKATETLKELQEKVTTPFYEAMDQASLDAEGVREKLLKMAMQMYDVVSSFQSVNMRKIEQGLNIGIVKGDKTEEQALEEAKIITDIEQETPRWIRSIASGVKGIGVEDKGIIISGYKLAPQREDLVAESPTEES